MVRSVLQPIGVVGVRVALVCVLAALILVQAAGAGHVSAAGPSGLRILYASDWTGPMEIFAADPFGRGPIQQVTFAPPEGSCHWAAACGYTRPQPSPDGRRLAYWSTADVEGDRTATLWIARADGTHPRRLGSAFDAAWSPDSRRLAYLAPDGVHVLSASGTDRIVDRAPTQNDYFHAVRWSPDGGSLAFISHGRVIVLRRGHEDNLGGGDWPNSLAWSPDGRRIAFSNNEGVFVGTSSGGLQRLVYRDDSSSPRCWQQPELAFSPDGRRLAFQLGGTPGFLDTHTWRSRTVHDFGRDIAWSPDGRSLLLAQGCERPDGFWLESGNVEAITPAGHVSTLVSAKGSYGGQIVSAAWTMPPDSARYGPARPVTGIFAGGPVQRLAADAGRVAYVACGRIEVWTPATDATVQAQPGGTSGCLSPFSREAHVGSLAIAGDRLLWWWADLGNAYGWSMREAIVGSQPVDVAKGGGSLGCTPAHGTGTAVGAGSLLVMSSWTSHCSNGAVVDQQTLQRVDAGGCPCTAISISPSLYVPLDVDENRIVASGNNETRILAADGTILLSLPVPTLAAQLSGSQLVLASGNTLRVYDATSGALDATWPLPSGPVGHDCDGYADPSCGRFPPSPPPVTLEDVAHGLAAYILDGQVHLLRLTDGADRIVGYGTLARFTDVGLVYADGARIRLTPHPARFSTPRTRNRAAHP